MTLAKKWDIGMGYPGGALIVWNRAVMEHGDYKTVAVIGQYGHISWRCPVPDDVLEKVEQEAEKYGAKGRAQFEALDKYKQYEMILDRLNYEQFSECCRDKRPIEQKLPEWREKYYESY